MQAGPSHAGPSRAGPSHAGRPRRGAAKTASYKGMDGDDVSDSSSGRAPDSSSSDSSSSAEDPFTSPDQPMPPSPARGGKPMQAFEPAARTGHMQHPPASKGMATGPSHLHQHAQHTGLHRTPPNKASQPYHKRPKKAPPPVHATAEQQHLSPAPGSPSMEQGHTSQKRRRDSASGMHCFPYLLKNE